MWKVILGLVVLSFFVLGCESKRETKSAAEVQDASDYPDVALTLADGGEVNMRDLSGDNVLIFFQPDCRHCQIEAINIEERLDEFDGYTLYFVSSADMGAIDAFAESFELNDKENVKFAFAPTQSVLDNYGPIRTPSVYIYSNGKLKKHFDGQTEIQNILDAL